MYGVIRMNGLRNNTTNKKQDAAFYIMIIGSSIMVATALLCGFYFFIQLRRIDNLEQTDYQVYQKHYVLITEQTETEFWDEVYEGAYQEALKNQVYLERLGENLSVDYTINDLLRMAINASVDGIIVCGEENLKTQELVDHAVDKGIVVITVRQDMDNTRRQAFVGVNQYDLGMTYGKEILKVIDIEQKNPPKIYLLMDDSESETRQNNIVLAIRDAFHQATDSENLPDIQVKLIDTSDTFSAEEDIRDIFLDQRNLPDVIVCLNSTYTRCCYQAVVDYNRVGEVKLIGYFASDDILQAISKRIIFSTVRVEAEQMGRQCIDAMQEYEETGYANSYIPVEIEVIGKEEVEDMLREEE